MEKLNKYINSQFAKMCETGKLFVSEVSGSELWNIYLDNTENLTFRDPNSTSFNCNHCNNFIRRYGNIVTVVDGEISTMFDVLLDKDDEYFLAMAEMSKKLKSSPIVDVFFETFESLKSLPYEQCKKGQESFRLGIDKNYKKYTQAEVNLYPGTVNIDKVYTFNHFYLDLPSRFVDNTGKSIESIKAGYRDKYSTFKRCMEEIPLDTLEHVRDLINQGSLRDGDSHIHSVQEMITIKKSTEFKSDFDYWLSIYDMSERTAKFRNTLIGVLCVELAEGEEINKACLAFNKRVDPINYHKATPAVTPKMLENAKKEFMALGYTEDDLLRRFANLDDINVDEIHHTNVGDGVIPSVSVFDKVKTLPSRHKRAELEGVQEVSIDKFMKDILPTCTSVEAYLENSHESKMVSLTTSDSDRTMFKWSNPFSWTFNGNLAGESMITKNVREKGGKVDGVLRFSIMWADDNRDDSDLDAHCKEPNGVEIYYASSLSRSTGGNLDIDIQHPGGKLAVENITYPDLNRMGDGVYRFFVRQFQNRGSVGFKAEIAFGDQLFNYEYNQPVFRDIDVAEVTLKNGEFTINHKLPCSSTTETKEVYGLETNNFHKVNLVCLSPNHWGDNNAGNLHYMFMLEGCKTPHQIRTFHNENLKPELLRNHKRVMEVLANSTMIESTDKQLSGIGFNSTLRSELVVRLKGTHKRMLKIKF